MARKIVTIGIDLGTTTSCVAVKTNDEERIIDNRDGEHLTPSVVCFDKNGEQPVVGSNAILAASTAPENFVYEVKRMFGKGYHSEEVKTAMKYWSFKLKEIKTTGKAEDKNLTDNIGIAVTEKGKERIYEPVQVSAYVLNYLYESAKQRLGIAPSFVAITVPAYFNDGAKQRTLDAAKIAFSGKLDENNQPLDVKIVLLAEPTAAAMAYGSIMIKNKQVKDGQEERILVFDLGGGTYDVSILDFTYDTQNSMGQVRAIDGDNFLGGSDWDRVIINIAKARFAKGKEGVNLDEGISREEKLKNELRLRQEAIKVKTALSTSMRATFNLSCYRGTEDLIFEITRVEFERASRELFDRLKEKIKGALLSLEGITPVYYDDGRLNETSTIQTNKTISRNQSLESIIDNAKQTINKVIMVGGSSRIPKVKTVLEDFFNETADTPAISKKVVSPLNPDEAVAIGAAFYAHATCPDVEESSGPKLLLIDQVPLNLNIETLGGVATPIITARTPIPSKQTQVFSTAADKQTTVEINITQGNRPQSKDNYTVGTFILSGITPAPKGVPQIEITYEVDANNVLKVTALDKSTGNKQCFVKNMTQNLSDSDIDRMRKEAEEHAQKDAIFLERTTLRNQFESQLYAFLDNLDSMKVDADKKKEISDRLNEEENWIKNLADDVEPKVIKERMDKLIADIPNMMSGAAGSTTGTNNPDVEEVN